MSVAVAPGAVPLLGHVGQLRRDALGFLASLPEVGDIVEVRLAGRRAYVLCDGELVRKVFGDSQTYDKAGPLWDRARDAYATGLAVCAHAEHQRLRRLVQPAFRSDRYAGYAAIMLRELEAVTASWRAGDTVDVHAEMFDITARVSARTMFAAAMADDAVTTVREAIAIQLDEILRRVIVPWRSVDRLPMPGNRRFDAAGRRLRHVVAEIIDAYRRTGVDHGDLLSMLLAAPLSDDEIHDQVVQLLVAGSETTAATLAWTFHMLGQHPEVEHDLHAEVDAVLAGRTATWDDLERLELTGHLVAEVLRVWPPVWVMTRETTADVTLAGRTFPAGTTFVISPYLLHRRPELFADPTRFAPERWQEAGASPSGYVPFGGGTRKCVGARFATIEATLVVASIVSRWRLQPVPGVTIRPRAAIGLSPQPLPMTLHRRSTGETS